MDIAKLSFAPFRDVSIVLCVGILSGEVMSMREVLGLFQVPVVSHTVWCLTSPSDGCYL